MGSHPTWVRGLKLRNIRTIFNKAMSHPTWVRGLKFLAGKIRPEDWDVAPHVGAWIEIVKNGYLNYRRAKSHPTWVRGLK